MSQSSIRRGKGPAEVLLCLAEAPCVPVGWVHSTGGIPVGAALPLPALIAQSGSGLALCVLCVLRAALCAQGWLCVPVCVQGWICVPCVCSELLCVLRAALCALAVLMAGSVCPGCAQRCSVCLFLALCLARLRAPMPQCSVCAWAGLSSQGSPPCQFCVLCLSLLQPLRMCLHIRAPKPFPDVGCVRAHPGCGEGDICHKNWP